MEYDISGIMHFWEKKKENYEWILTIWLAIAEKKQKNNTSIIYFYLFC